MDRAQDILNDKQIRFLTDHLGVQFPAEDTSERDRLIAALAKRRSEADTVMQGHPDRAGEINGMIENIQQALDSGDAARAREGLFELAATLKGLANRSAELEELANASPAALAIASIDWRAAASTVAGQIKSIGAAIEKEIEEEDAGAEVKKLGQLAGLVEDRTGTLADAVDDLIGNNDPAQRKSLADSALEAAKDLSAFLEGNALLTHLLASPLDGGDDPDHAALLLAPLASVKAALAKTAASAN